MVAVVFTCILGTGSDAQANPNERTFSQPKSAIEKALKTMQSTLSGHLPVLDGFATGGEHPLDQYSRGYYQASVEIASTASGGSLVRVTTKVTAWYADPSAPRSGYQLLTSNGRIESDILDQISDHLTTEQSAEGSSSAPSSEHSRTAEDTKSSSPVPTRTFPSNAKPISSSVTANLGSEARASEKTTEPPSGKKSVNPLQTEAENLEEILKNTAHPKNLVAVKKSGTPVVPTPSLTAKPDFLASLHDEFEILDFNADWVHVRISGLSRGWIWRNSVEMPDGIPDTETRAASTSAAAADLFHVIREETAQFPGDWSPLRSKMVKIISVQKNDENAKDAGLQQRLEYAKFLLEKSYAELAKKPQEWQGVVLIFDSADGGMIAATAATLQQWRAGTLSDSALWHKCFFDPPETFDSTAPSGSK